MAKNFSWEFFPVKFVQEVLASDKTLQRDRPPKLYSEIERLAPYIDSVCSYPDAHFVSKYRRVIEDHFLANRIELVNVCSSLEKINYSDIRVLHKMDEFGKNTSEYDYAAMLDTLKRKELTDILITAYLNELYLTGRQINEPESFFSQPITVDLANSQLTSVPLYPFQEDAVRALDNYFTAENGKSGLLVMPTGGGKTRTSIYFLLKHLISKGYQVLWLAHRSMLLEQTSTTFYRLCPLINSSKKNMDELMMVCVSGDHCSAAGLQKEDNVIVGSVASLCRKTEYFEHILGEKVIVVVDEAHHTIAPSYRNTIEAVRRVRPDAKLLGLTATPVRIQDKATKALLKLFDNKIIYSIPMSELIANKVLADPQYIPIETNIDIEAIIDIDEKAYIRKWGEMPQSLMNKVAKTNERNDVIVKEYVEHKEEYGKTIIFALNAIHCIALYDAFKAKGIRVGFVYSRQDDNAEIIERFKNNNRPDGIDVLININILTEGSDIPDIQTVFLTRPTTSDVLLMQMVGRGMRGKNCGGTDTVNIVDFNDKWNDISKWLNPTFLFGDEPVKEPAVVETKGSVSLIPYDAIRDIIKGITYTGAVGLRKGTVLPLGWYDVYDEDGCDTKVIVFDSQIAGYDDMKADCERDIKSITEDGKELQLKYFSNFGVMPPANEVKYVADYVKETGTFPVLQLFEWRDSVEPYQIAKEIEQGNMRYNDYMRKITEIYRSNTEMIESLYGGLEEYTERIFNCMVYPNGVKPLGTKVEAAEKKFYKLSEEPFGVDLDQLLDEVIAEQSSNFRTDFVRPQINWTKKPAKQYFAQYLVDEKIIFINCLLDSKDIPVEVIKYLIYHECLHQEFTEGHGREFRKKEHKYPDFLKYDHFLDITFKDFVVGEGM